MSVALVQRLDELGHLVLAQALQAAVLRDADLGHELLGLRFAPAAIFSLRERTCGLTSSSGNPRVMSVRVFSFGLQGLAGGAAVAARRLLRAPPDDACVPNRGGLSPRMQADLAIGHPQR